MTDVERLLQELSVAHDWRDLLDCTDRFNNVIAKLTPRARERAIEQFTDIARERNCRRQRTAPLP